MINNYFKIPSKIWKDKRIKLEMKLVYSYLYSKGFDKYIVDLNVGELQQVVSINNVGFKKVLQRLATCEYLLYNEYDKGMYSIKLLG